METVTLWSSNLLAGDEAALKMRAAVAVWAALAAGYIFVRCFSARDKGAAELHDMKVEAHEPAAANEGRATSGEMPPSPAPQLRVFKFSGQASASAGSIAPHGSYCAAPSAAHSTASNASKKSSGSGSAASSVATNAIGGGVRSAGSSASSTRTVGSKGSASVSALDALAGGMASAASHTSRTSRSSRRSTKSEAARELKQAVAEVLAEEDEVDEEEGQVAEE